MRAIDAGPVQSPAHDALYRHAAERDHWSDLGQEDARARQARPGPFDVGDEGVADLLRERQTLLAMRLSADGQHALIPVDLREAEVGNLACPQSEPGEEQNDGAVAKTVPAVAGGEDAHEVRRRQEARRRRELPVREARDGVVPSSRASSGRDQVAKERTRGACDSLRVPSAVRPCPLEHEPAHGRGGVGRGIVAERSQQVGQDPFAQIQRGVGNAALFAHPAAIAGQDRPRLFGPRRSRRGREDAFFAKIGHEQLRGALRGARRPGPPEDLG